MVKRAGRRGVLFGLATAVCVSVLCSVAYALPSPSVPAAIAVPPGNVVYLVGHAQGAQIYRCQPATGGYAWTLVAPAAVLRDASGNLIIWHYAGPSWRALDGSTVTAVRVASANAPVPNAIPWLLLKVSSATPGPNGGTLAQTTYIQRINTTGGVAPATGCDAAHVGATTAVPYTADYYFYRAV
jgi:hypothetical protein